VKSCRKNGTRILAGRPSFTCSINVLFFRYERSHPRRFGVCGYLINWGARYLKIAGVLRSRRHLAVGSAVPKFRCKLPMARSRFENLLIRSRISKKRGHNGGTTLRLTLTWRSCRLRWIVFDLQCSSTRMHREAGVLPVFWRPHGFKDAQDKLILLAVTLVASQGTFGQAVSASIADLGF